MISKVSPPHAPQPLPLGSTLLMRISSISLNSAMIEGDVGAIAGDDDLGVGMNADEIVTRHRVKAARVDPISLRRTRCR